MSIKNSFIHYMSFLFFNLTQNDKILLKTNLITHCCYDSSTETNAEGQSRVREVDGKRGMTENKVSILGKQV